MNIYMRNILRLQQMLLIVNSTPHATITATLLAPAERYTADQVTCAWLLYKFLDCVSPALVVRLGMKC